MATINLRPWREERRERLKKEFIQVTAVFGVMAFLIWFGWNTVLNSWVSNQGSRNQMLQAEIKSLELKVVEINELKQKKEDLIERMKAIQSLQGTRPLIVHLFDELAKTMPEGVFYKKIERKGSKMSVEGTAESNQRVSSLMRNLDESEWLSDPNLTKIVANKTVGEQGNDFMLTFDISPPGVEDKVDVEEGASDKSADKKAKPADKKAKPADKKAKPADKKAKPDKAKPADKSKGE